MKKNNIRIAILAIAIFISGISLFIVKADDRRIPDFAYPKNVENDAKASLMAALKSGNSRQVLGSAIELGVAKSLVSSDSAVTTALMFDSLSSLLPSPYNRLALLLEARTYNDIYNADRWIYNNRSLPLGSYPANPLEWSRDLFSKKITGLVEEAMEGASHFSSVPLSDISSLLEYSDAESLQGLSIFDFMTLTSTDLLDPYCQTNGSTVLPFENIAARGRKDIEISASGLRKTILERAIEFNSGSNKNLKALSLLVQRMSNTMTDENRKDFNKRWIETFIDTPYCSELLCDFYTQYGHTPTSSDSEQTLSSIRMAYSRLSEYESKFPDAPGIDQVKNMIGRISREQAVISLPDRFMPGSDIHGEISLSNIRKCYLLLYKIENSNFGKSVKLSSLNALGGRPVDIIEIETEGEKPFVSGKNFTFGKRSPGCYAVAVSTTPYSKGLITGNAYDRADTFIVSDISMIVTPDNRNPDLSRIYVVLAENQKPLSGVTVRWYRKGPYGNKLEKTETTGKDGYVRGRKGTYLVTATKGKNYYSVDFYGYKDGSEKVYSKTGRIFTDLSIYRPGQRLKASVVLYKEEGTVLSALSKEKFKLFLFNANYQLVDSLSLETDTFGRVDAEFVIPDNGLLGKYYLELYNDKKQTFGSNTFFEVAEYKSPTFRVCLDGIEGNYSVGDTVRIKGKVMTYSGMPLDNASVRFNVTYRGVPWLYSNENATYGSEVSSGSDGSFLIELPTGSLRDTRYAFGSYVLNITATDRNGEAESAEPCYFSLGESYRIVPDLSDLIKQTDKPLSFNVRIMDILYHPVRKKIDYKLRLKGGDIVDSGSFESPLLQLNKRLESGQYELTMQLCADTTVSVTSDFIIFASDDRRPPVETPLWVPETRIEAPEDTRFVNIPIGSSYTDSHIFVEITDCERILERKWITLNGVNDNLKIPVPADHNRIRVFLSGMHDHRGVSDVVEVIPFSQTTSLKITSESFREKLTPGASEKWKFLFTLNDNKLAGLPVMAVMSNKALNVLAPFSWDFNPAGNVSYLNPYYISTASISELNYMRTVMSPSYHNVKNPGRISWQLFGYNFYGNPLNKVRLRGLSMSKNAASGAQNDALEMEVENQVYMSSAVSPVPESAKKESFSADMVTEEAVADAYEGDSYHDDGGENVLREIECPSAFFMPALLTDADGIAGVDFAVPDFNGTWQFQIMGYTPEMKGGVLMLDAVASKPVMVSMNAPRFLYCGDRTVIMATLFNNTDNAVPVGGCIEIFDPVTDTVLYSREFEGVELSPSGSRSVRIEYPVGLADMIGIRAYASGAGHKDGEQTVIPVLPAYTPVWESENFYISADEVRCELSIPDTREGAVVSLHYNDNPVWECVTALPVVCESKSENILALANELFARSVASGLVERFPQIKEAVKLFLSRNDKDSMLVSTLVRDAQFKTVALSNTPWVQDASSQTLRMSRLGELTDQELCKKRIEEIISNLRKRQQSDGGWSWCEGMSSSEFISGKIVELMGRIAALDFLPDKSDDMICEAIGFCDAAWVREAEKAGDKFSPTSMLGYLYSRSFFNKAGSPAFENLKVRAIKDISKGWKKFGIYEKATASILLYKENEKDIADDILNSLRQYASFSKGKGIWYDNLKGGFTAMPKLIVTSRALEAFSTVSKDIEMIDGLRRWLLLEKQVEDWGNGAGSAQVIAAVLTTGSNWTDVTSAPVVKVDGKRLDLTPVPLSGSINTVIDASGKLLTIERKPGAPAWGGVMASYYSPIRDVKQTACKELKISKKIVKLEDTPDGTVASSSSPTVGDRIRVTLTLTADMDLEYVAVTDGKAACMQNVNSLSGYELNGGLWLYREVRTESTNLFIPYLPKGTYMISYDCYIDRDGEYSGGIATAQSQYYPLITAHSGGILIDVSER